MFLPVTVTTTYALLDALRIPRQIVVHYERAELEFDTFRARFCGDHDAAFFTEIIHQRGAQVRRLRTRHPIRAGMLLQPYRVNRFRPFISVRAIEQNDTLLEWTVGEDAEQIIL